MMRRDNSSKTAPAVPVLIAGGGPVGLGLAIELGRSGIPCFLVEKRDGTVALPKMSGMSNRCMEINRRWGVAEAVRGVGWPSNLPQDYVYCTSLTGYELARERVAPFAEQRPAHTPEPRASCAQSYYDPILLAKARSLPSVTIRLNTALQSFSQRVDRIEATVRETRNDEEKKISAAYLIACDGAGGTVATTLSAAYEGRGVLAPSFNVFFRSRQLAAIHDKGWARFFRFTDTGGSWGELVGIDGLELWRLSVFSHHPDWDAHAYVRRLAGRTFAYEIISAMPWDRCDRVAARYRYGRVFLCGDAAHQNSPTGGLGLHLGLVDAVDLGWKLTAVLQGWGGEKLLDGYEAERKAIAHACVRASTENFALLTGLPSGPAIADDSDDGVAERLRWCEAFRGSRGASSPLYTDNLLLGGCYEDSPLCVGDGSAAIPLERLDFAPTARPGARAPHAWLPDGRSTLDLFGAGFVLLRFGGPAAAVGTLGEAARSRGVPLRVVDIDDPEIAALYEKRLVLVRPDGHVAWRGDDLPVEPDQIIDHVRGATIRDGYAGG
jgi:2-polyprenyl-6-methoxyphenol hydroxylase-like FAD-dependent oxidoreductase